MVSTQLKIDLSEHFVLHDPRAEEREKERLRRKKQWERESKTTVGAVKRLISRVDSLALSENLLGPIGIVRHEFEDDALKRKGSAQNTKRTKDPNNKEEMQNEFSMRASKIRKIKRA